MKMSRILILYSSTDGHTIKICNALKQQLEQDQHRVELVSVENSSQVDLPSSDKIVIGASIRYGRHSKLIYDFINSNQHALESKPNAFFSVNIVARKPEKSSPDTNPYLLKFLKQIAWRPRHVAVFAGKLDYPKYGVIDRAMIRFIMLLTHGPTDPASVIEFTDWQKVAAFGKTISEM